MMPTIYPNLAVWLTVLLAWNWSPKASAQYLQNYQKVLQMNPVDRVVYDTWKYQPTADRRNFWRHVIDLSQRTNEAYYIYYNCYYLTNICANVERWRATTRGQNPHPGAGISSNKIFAFDFDSGDDDGARSRKNFRRDNSCPTNSWKNSHTCPEPGANGKDVWRHDGMWPFKELNYTNADKNYIMDVLNPQNSQGTLVRRSLMQYTCDEFPAASWVEGGNGWDGQSPSSTTCAGHCCVDGSRQGEYCQAEQDWQGESHGHLRRLLIARIQERKEAHGEFDWFGDAGYHDVAFFRHDTIYEKDSGVAVQIFLVDTTNDEQSADPATYKMVLQDSRQMKRENDGDDMMEDEPAKIPRRRQALDPEEAWQVYKAGQGRRFHISVHANTSVAFDASLETQVLDLGRSSSTLARRTFRDNQNQQEQHPKHKFAFHKRDNQSSTARPLLKKASASDLAKARKIVADAIAASAKLNRARLDNPSRNQYRLKPGTIVGGSVVGKRSSRHSRREDAPPPPPLLDITEEIAAAAALVSEADAVIPEGGVPATEPISNVTRRAPVKGTFWMETIARKGTVPWGTDPSYKVFRNVLDYGAKGDGVTDDTKAIKDAMNDGRRCGEKCNGSTVKNAIVYFPPGKYRVSSTIPLPFGTQVIGDANNRPEIVATSAFVGLGVLSTSEYTGGGTGTDGLDQQWFVNTANFYRQIRNIIIDVRGAPKSEITACLHYQIAQATSLQNIELRAGPGSKGIYAENGSGGQISDVVFRGGDIGLFGGNQQFTAQRLTFDGCSIGVHVIWDWGWVWKSITMTNVPIGFKFVANDKTGHIGSASIMDSSFSGVGTAVIIAPPSSTAGTRSTGLVLDNVALSSVTNVVSDSSGKVLFSGGGQSRVDQWVLGPVYAGSADAGNRTFSNGGKVGRYTREQSLVDSKGNYFERPKPQYEGRGVGDFLHVKDFGATGNGATDDTAAFQQALDASARQNKVLFVDAGSYILTSTVTVPIGAKVVGETWSQLVASGPAFSDATKPLVMLRVGAEGDMGSVELQDLIFTTKGPTAGAVLVEWNLAANEQGSAALWDCHVRIGGALGTGLTPAECPALTSGIAPGCNAASLMMHLTKGASGYFENMWLWVADHMIDDPDLNDANNTMVQNSVYAARGFLIESTRPTWLYGTASEHAVFYQYNFLNAENIFAGMIQTESPYYQPTPNPPAPFTNVVGKFPGDPDYSCKVGDEFNGCDESWAVMMRGCEDVFIAGAGLYSWFSTYTQECIDTQACQKAMVWLKDNHASVRIQHLITIGAKYMAVMEGKGIAAKDNLNVDAHPFWSQISLIDVTSDNGQFNDMIRLDPKLWDMAQPQFECAPPCKVKLPAWTGATSTVNYPLMTVSQGTWTSVITAPPLTLSKLGFEIVTLDNVGGGTGLKRRTAFGDFWPKPQTTTGWPVVVYNGPDGQQSTASPTGAFPTPPPSIGPGAPPPDKGAWPKVAIQARGSIDPNKETYGRKGPEYCRIWRGQSPDYWDMEDRRFCDQYIRPDNGQMPLENGSQNWNYGSISPNGGALGSIDGEPIQSCPLPPVTSSSTTTTTTTTSAAPTATRADPQQNALECYQNHGGGFTEGNQQLQNAIRSYCNYVAGVFGVPRSAQTKRDTFQVVGPKSAPYTSPQLQGHTVAFYFAVLEGCTWTWNHAECSRYLMTAVNSCNCGGVDGKQGGYGKNNCIAWRTDPNI